MATGMPTATNGHRTRPPINATADTVRSRSGLPRRAAPWKRPRTVQPAIRTPSMIGRAVGSPSSAGGRGRPAPVLTARSAAGRRDLLGAMPRQGSSGVPTSRPRPSRGEKPPDADHWPDGASRATRAPRRYQTSTAPPFGVLLGARRLRRPIQAPSSSPGRVTNGILEQITLRSPGCRCRLVDHVGDIWAYPRRKLHGEFASWSHGDDRRCGGCRLPRGCRCWCVARALDGRSRGCRGIFGGFLRGWPVVDGIDAGVGGRHGLGAPGSRGSVLHAHRITFPTIAA